MGIAANMGGGGALIQTQLSNGDDFMFYAHSGDGVIAFTVDGAGPKLMKDSWVEPDGTAVMTDDFGQECRIGCDGNGGIIVSIEGLGFNGLTWNVSAYGVVSMSGNVCGCSGSTFAPDQNKVCDIDACNLTAACRPSVTTGGTPAGYCQPGSTPN